MKVFLVHEDGALPTEPTAYVAETKYDAEMDYIATYCATTEDTKSELVEYVRADSRDPAKLEGLLEAVRETIATLPPADMRDSSHRRRLLDALAAFEGREGE